MKAKRITRRHIGLPCQFRAYGGYEGKIMPGTIEQVRRGIAKIVYDLIEDSGLSRGRFTAYVEVKTDRVSIG